MALSCCKLSHTFNWVGLTAEAPLHELREPCSEEDNPFLLTYLKWNELSEQLGYLDSPNWGLD